MNPANENKSTFNIVALVGQHIQTAVTHLTAVYLY